jgi:SAM-dependent methyltransferase
VYCHSVFTHIDETYQDAWLRELQRVVKPGGRLLLSVNGERSFHEFENGRRANGLDSSAFRAVRDMKGLLYIAEDDWTGGPFPDFYHSTFHTPAYVFAHLEPLLQDSRVHPTGFTRVSGLCVAGADGAE